MGGVGGNLSCIVLFFFKLSRNHRKINRGYYMAFQHEKRNFVSPSNHVMFYFLLHKHQ